jgi:hypothetical protein
MSADDAPGGVYGDACKEAMESTQAVGVILIVINGSSGTGFSVAGPIEMINDVPEILEQIAGDIRASRNTIN